MLLHGKRSTRVSSTRVASLPILAGVLLLAAGGAASHGDTASYTVTGWTFEGQNLAYTLGYSFSPTTNIEVTALGQWVPGSGGVAGTIVDPGETVGIFNATGDLILTTAWTQSNATLISNTLASGSEFRYTDITTLYSASARTLIAGQTYTMAGTTNVNSYSTEGFSLTPDPSITLFQSVYANAGALNYPFTSNGYNMYGENFAFVPGSGTSSTPEPGTMALFFGLGTVGAFAAKRRRRV